MKATTTGRPSRTSSTPQSSQTTSTTPNPSPFEELTNSCTATANPTKNGWVTVTRSDRSRVANKTRTTKPTPCKSDKKGPVQNTAKNVDKPSLKCDTAPSRAAVGTRSRKSTQPSGRNATTASSSVHDMKVAQDRALLPLDNLSQQQQQHPNYFRGRNHGTPCTTAGVSVRAKQKQNVGGNSRSASIAINNKILTLGKSNNWNGILALFLNEKDNFDNVNYASVMVQLGRMEWFDRSDTRFLAFLDSLLENIEKQGLSWIQVRQASNIIHAIGKMELINPRTQQILGWISREDIANQFVEEAVRIKSPQNVANTVWAFATLQVEPPHLLAAIEARSDWLVNKGSAQDMANTAWAFATLKTEAPNLLSKIEAQSDWLVQNGTPQNVANTAWAFATLKTEAPNLLSKIEAKSDWLVQNGTPQAVANTAWAFATIGFEGTRFFDALDQNLTTTAVLRKGLDPQAVANLCYAIATAGRVNESVVLLQELWNNAIQLFVAKAMFLDETFCQLVQSQLFASAWEVELSTCPASMTRRMKKALKAQSAADNVVSRSSKEVSKLLRDIGFDHECEVSLESNILGGMMAIDFACTKRKVAIEYDGEFHFLKALSSGELTSERNGRTKAKRRLLEQLGWTVINLDFRHYMKACRESEEEAWLWAELKQAGVQLPYFD